MDKACKEMAMEKMLRDLEVESNMIMTWNGMEFDLILTIIYIILTKIMNNIAMITIITVMIMIINHGQVNWKDMEFDHEEHARTGHNLLRTSEELIETLEENQVVSLSNCCTCNPFMMDAE